MRNFPKKIEDLYVKRDISANLIIKLEDLEMPIVRFSIGFMIRFKFAERLIKTKNDEKIDDNILDNMPKKYVLSVVIYSENTELS